MFQLTLVTPTKKILEGAELKKIFVPGYNGEIEILPNHAPLVTTLGSGVLKYELESQGETKAVAISWGYCEVFDDKVTVLAETAESPEEIDLARAEETRQAALEKLGKASYEEVGKYQRKFQRAEARINTAKFKSTH